MHSTKLEKQWPIGAFVSEKTGLGNELFSGTLSISNGKALAAFDFMNSNQSLNSKELTFV